MAHDIWKDNIKLMLNGCHDCWTYKAIKFAFEAKLINFNPDINIFSMQTLIEVCNISFNEDHLIFEYAWNCRFLLHRRKGTKTTKLN